MATTSESPSPKNHGPILAVLTLVFGLGALVVRTGFPLVTWAFYVLLGLFVAALGGLVWVLRTSVSRRTAMFGLNSSGSATHALSPLRSRRSPARCRSSSRRAS